MGTSPLHPDAVVIRPKPALLRSGALGLSLVMVALFGSLYLVTIPDGPWMLVLMLQLLSLLFATFLFLRYRASSIELADGQIVSRDFPYPTEHIAHAAITRALLAESYVGTTTDTYLCLFLLGSEPKPLLRMRTKYWERSDIMKVAAASGAPIITLPQPLTAQELAAELNSR